MIGPGLHGALDSGPRWSTALKPKKPRKQSPKSRRARVPHVRPSPRLFECMGDSTQTRRSGNSRKIECRKSNRYLGIPQILGTAGCTPEIAPLDFCSGVDTGANCSWPRSRSLACFKSRGRAPTPPMTATGSRSLAGENLACQSSAACQPFIKGVMHANAKPEPFKSRWHQPSQGGRHGRRRRAPQ